MKVEQHSRTDCDRDYIRRYENIIIEQVNHDKDTICFYGFINFTSWKPAFNTIAVFHIKFK